MRRVATDPRTRQISWIIPQALSYPRIVTSSGSCEYKERKRRKRKERKGKRKLRPRREDKLCVFNVQPQYSASARILLHMDSLLAGEAYPSFVEDPWHLIQGHGNEKWWTAGIQRSGEMLEREVPPESDAYRPLSTLPGTLHVFYLQHLHVLSIFSLRS